MLVLEAVLLVVLGVATVGSASAVVVARLGWLDALLRRANARYASSEDELILRRVVLHSMAQDAALIAWMVLLPGGTTGVLLLHAFGVSGGLSLLCAVFVLLLAAVLQLSDPDAPHPWLGTWLKLTVSWLGVATVSLVLVGADHAIESVLSSRDDAAVPPPPSVVLNVLSKLAAVTVLVAVPLASAYLHLKHDPLAWLKLDEPSSAIEDGLGAGTEYSLDPESVSEMAAALVLRTSDDHACCASSFKITDADIDTADVFRENRRRSLAPLSAADKSSPGILSSRCSRPSKREQRAEAEAAEGDAADAAAAAASMPDATASSAPTAAPAAAASAPVEPPAAGAEAAPAAAVTSTPGPAAAVPSFPPKSLVRPSRSAPSAPPPPRAPPTPKPACASQKAAPLTPKAAKPAKGPSSPSKTAKAPASRPSANTGKAATKPATGTPRAAGTPRATSRAAPAAPAAPTAPAAPAAPAEKPVAKAAKAAPAKAAPAEAALAAAAASPGAAAPTATSGAAPSTDPDETEVVELRAMLSRKSSTSRRKNGSGACSTSTSGSEVDGGSDGYASGSATSLSPGGYRPRSGVPPPTCSLQPAACALARACCGSDRPAGDTGAAAASPPSAATATITLAKPAAAEAPGRNGSGGGVCARWPPSSSGNEGGGAAKLAPVSCGLGAREGREPMGTNADRAAQCASEAQNATDNARSIDLAANRAMLNSFAAPAEEAPSPPPSPPGRLLVAAHRRRPERLNWVHPLQPLVRWHE